MTHRKDNKRRDPTDVVAPYARIRVIVAVICIIIAVVFLTARALAT